MPSHQAALEATQREIALIRWAQELSRAMVAMRSCMECYGDQPRDWCPSCSASIMDAVMGLTGVVKAKPLSHECTGVAARWCAVHGDCECSEEEDYNDEACPLHSPKSNHADAPHED